LFIGIIAARLMVPEDFGIFAVTLVVYSIVVNVSDLGVGSALIQTEEDIDKSAPTAVTLSIVTASLLGIGMFFAAPLAASVLGAPGATLPIQVMSSVVFIAGLSAVPSALLTRYFRQDLRFRADIAAFIVGNTVLIVLAAMGWGAMALALSRVAVQVVTVVVLLIVGPRYKPGFDPGTARGLIRFGMPLVGAQLLGFTIGSMDAIVLGRALGSTKLGVYTLANNIASWPMSLSSFVVVNVGLPMLSRVAASREELERYLANAIKALSGVFLFVTAMCISLAYPLIYFVYGTQWVAAAPVLGVLAAYGSLRVILFLFNDVLIAVGSTRALMWVQVVWLLTLTAAMVVGVNAAGLIGVAFAQVGIVVLIVIPLELLIMRRLAGVRPSVVLRGLLHPTIAAVLAGLAAWAVALYIPVPGWALLAGGTVGALVYASALFRWFRRLISEIRTLYTREGTGEDVTNPVADSDRSAPPSA